MRQLVCEGGWGGVRINLAIEFEEHYNVTNPCFDYYLENFFPQFCEAAPKLPTCKRAEPAYTHAMFFDQLTFEPLGVTASLHCSCPSPRKHIFYEATDDIIDNMQMLGSVYTCSMVRLLK